MQKPSIKQKKTSESEMLNQQIRHLLFLNPLIDMNTIKRHLAMLPSQMISDKLITIKILTKQRRNFVEVANQHKAYFKRHIQRWEEEIGPVTTSDVIELLEGSDMSIMEVAPHLITPLHIERWLTTYLIGQPEYARKLSFCYYLHNLRVKEEGLVLPRPNLLIFGPSGVGKTYGPQKLSEFFGLPFGVVNCNSLVQEGIMGNSLTTVFTHLYMKYGEEMADAVIVFDEFDKLFERGEFNERILNELLNIIDDNNTVSFYRSDDIYNHEKVCMKTNKMMFIFTGVFRGIEDIVRKRLGDHAIGFSCGLGNNLEGDYHQYVTDDDFANYFHRAELTGRIQQYAYARELQEDDLVGILLHSKESPVDTFVNYFKIRNIELIVTEGGARAIASASFHRHLGVRGLKSMMFKVLQDDMYSLDQKKIVINRKYVERKTA